MEISKGRYKLGNKTTVNGREVEVLRTFFKQNKTNITEGRSVSIGKYHIWPSYIIDNTDATTFNFTAVAYSEWGHMQGEFDFRYGQSQAPSMKVISPIDPAGGHGTISIVAKESSLWHRLKIKIRVTLQGKENTNDIGDISFPIGVVTYKYDEGGQKDLTETIDRNKNYIIEALAPSVDTTNKVKTSEYIIAYNTNCTTEHDTLNYDYNDKDYTLNYEISANNEVLNKTGKVEIVSYYGYDEGILTEYTLDQPILLASWTQLPNILYFVSMAWVSKPSSKDSDPVLEDSMTVEYNDTTFNMYLYIELGVSPNGGHDIYWNQNYTLNGKSLDATAPSDIAKYVTIECLNGKKSDGSENNHSKNYTKFTSSTMWQYGNYVKVTGMSLANNETNNTDRIQQYYVDNMTFTNDNLMTSGNRKIGAVTSDRTDDKKNVNIDFEVIKYSRTSPWNVNINALFNYGKYTGSTNGKDINIE